MSKCLSKPFLRISIFKEFLNPTIFDNLGIEIDIAPTYMNNVKPNEKAILERNVKLFYYPEDNDCSEMIKQIESLNCIQTAIGYPMADKIILFKDRVIFEYLGA